MGIIFEYKGPSAKDPAAIKDGAYTREREGEGEMKWTDASVTKPPASTAMDTRRVLVWGGFCGQMGVRFGWWNEGADRWYIENSPSEPDVTHWMPLPEPPQ